MKRRRQQQQQRQRERAKHNGGCVKVGSDTRAREQGMLDKWIIWVIAWVTATVYYVIISFLVGGGWTANRKWKWIEQQASSYTATIIAHKFTNNKKRKSVYYNINFIWTGCDAVGYLFYLLYRSRISFFRFLCFSRERYKVSVLIFRRSQRRWWNEWNRKRKTTEYFSFFFG